MSRKLNIKKQDTSSLLKNNKLSLVLYYVWLLLV